MILPRKIEAKNGLENYCFTMRNTLNEEKLKEKFQIVSGPVKLKPVSVFDMGSWVCSPFVALLPSK